MQFGNNTLKCFLIIGWNAMIKKNPQIDIDIQASNINYLLNQAFDSIHLGMMFVDTNLKIIEWNKAAENVTGYLKKEVLNQPCSLLKFSDQDCSDLCQKHCRMLKVFAQKRQIDTFLFGTYLTHKNGSKIPVMSTASPLTTTGDKLIGGVEIFFDTSCLESLKKELESRVYLNGLTHLYNRQKFQDVMNQEISATKRYHQPLSLLFIDIDNFKNYNDLYGHLAGDELLKTLANLLKENVRESDTVFRFGGEEFVVILTSTSSNQAKLLAEKLRATVEAHHFKPDNSTPAVHKTISIGIAEYGQGYSASELIEMADEAMYRAKKSGKNKVCSYDSKQDGQSPHRGINR
jgi:diguanylate cyclase (GGDEF)-like protein/PAS domain S-box-containing protein